MSVNIPVVEFFSIVMDSQIIRPDFPVSTVELQATADLFGYSHDVLRRFMAVVLPKVIETYNKIRAKRK